MNGFLAIVVSSYTQAAVFTPTFDTPPFPGTQFNVDAAHNAYYNTNYGITVENAYLYKDSLDTFDGVGISTRLVQNIGTPQVGRINFLDTTDFITVDYWSILDGARYEAFSSTGTLLSSFVANANELGTKTLGGGIISYLLFSQNGGFGQVTGLTYNYDGTTGGGNTDLGKVPVPAAVWLFGSALSGLGLIRRRKAA